MKELWRLVDGLLRGREAVSSEEALGRMRVLWLVMSVLLLAAAYGVFMGVYALSSREAAEYRQVASCMWKVPALFLLTLLICFPSLYVFSTLLGSRLSFLATLKALLGIVTITVTVLASFGPIMAFFSLSTENYAFMKLLNVAFFTVAGLLGVGALLKALRFLLRPQVPVIGDMPPIIGQKPSADEDRQIKRVFRIWILIYALVGAQMGWVLRPFIGDPQSPFAWFRARQANFFIDVWQTFLKLFS
jgi:hypothetical protein